jgi:ArsR family transcriptional regulator
LDEIYNCTMVQECKSEPQNQKLRQCCARAERLLEPELFRALGDPTRAAVLIRLAELGEPSTVTQVACCCPVDLSVVSRHLAVLRRAGIVAGEKRGKEMLHRIRYATLAATLRSMADAIEACCPTDDPPNKHSEIEEISP